MTARPALTAVALLTLPAALAAGVVALAPGLAGEVRAALPLPEPAGAPAVDGVAVAVTNGRLALCLLVAAAVAGRIPDSHMVFDLVVGLLVAVNAGAVGVALGAHGLALLPWLAHLPLEAAGFAVALAAYLAGRRAPLAWSSLGRLAVASGVLLAAGALVEAVVPAGALGA